MPPASLTGRRVTVGVAPGTVDSGAAVADAGDCGTGDCDAGGSTIGTTSTVAWSGPPTGRTEIRSRPDGLALRVRSRSAVSDAGRSLP